METNWARAEMEAVPLWDRRCVTSLIRICAHLAARPEESFSAACGTAGRQAAHRIFEHTRTTVQTLLHGHVLQTARRCRDHPLVLALQDTTELDYSSHPATEGLGPIGKGTQRGLLAHSLLAVTPAGLPLGLLQVAIWARDPATVGKSDARRQRKTAEKESQKWLAALQAVEAALAPGQPVLVVADREADVFAYLAAPRRPETHLLLRACQPRVVWVHSGAGEGSRRRTDLLSAARTAKPVGTLRVSVPRQPGQREREASLTVRATTVVIQPPQHPAPGERAQPQAVQLVCATEEEPPAGEEPIQWLLVTTLPLPDGAGACRVVGYYARRWGIERFHYTLKSGCQVERLQMDDAQTLSKALALYCVVAWRLLFLTHIGRTEPERPATEVLTWEEVEVVARATGRPVATAHAVVRAIAKLGGFEGSPSAGEPGVKSLWRGLRRLEAMVEGWRLARGQE